MQEVKTLGYDMFIEANCERLTDKIKKCEQIVMVTCKEQVISTDCWQKTYVHQL